MIELPESFLPITETFYNSLRLTNMSSAFVKEGDSEQLRDVPPNLTALLYYLRRENGTTIYELRREYREKYGREIYELSDGLGYMLNNDNQWQIVLD